MPTVGEIVSLVEGQYSGDPALPISAVRPLAEARDQDLAFLSGSRYEHLLDTTAAAAILVPADRKGEDRRFIRVADPQLALAAILQKWFAEIPRPPVGTSTKASVATTAAVGEGSRIGANVVIGERAQIGRDVTIFEGCSVGADVSIGDQTVLYANVTLYHGTRIGRRCIVHSGAVIGADGYGFVTSGGVHRKIPQVGRVRIDDDVEIGAGTTIDRATLGETVIGEGTKIDNLVQIGHNVKIGRHCLIVSQVGIAGSTELGDYVVLGGQAGLAGHLQIGSGVKVGAQSAVMKSYTDAVTLSGTPARPLREHLRSEALVRNLPELVARIEELERRIGSPDKKTEERTPPAARKK